MKDLEEVESSVTRLLDLLEALKIKAATPREMDLKTPGLEGYISPFVERMGIDVRHVRTD